jgi:hypothetical protein
MPELAYYPIVMFAISLVVLSAAAWAGALVGRRLPLDEDMRSDFNVMLGAALTFLALIIGFTFSMASNRYDQRKNLEEAEANAIGTEYSRAALLPPSDKAKIQASLKAYVDLRIRFYTDTDADARRGNDARTAKMQGELWNAILPVAAAAPNPVVALAVAGMNDVLNAQSYTQAAFVNRVPTSAWP